MLRDISAMNPKGHVKLELYNDNGVFYKKEKKNLVVQSANKIVAEMMADPTKVLRINQVDKGNTALSANTDSLFVFALKVQHELKTKFENNWGASNTVAIFEIEELKGITSLEKVTVGEAELVINRDVFLRDAAKGKIEFNVAPIEAVSIQYHKVNNSYMKFIEGTEVVKVNGIVWKRGTAAANDTKTYKINYRTGEVLFETAQTNVEVTYAYNMSYALGFMALGGKPNAQHPNYQPVEFGNTNKLDIDMKNEYAGSRMPIQYPASISTGATEIEPAIPTQPIAVVTKTKDVTVTHNGDNVTKLLAYELPNIHDSGSGNTGRTLYELVSVRNTTTSTTIDLQNVRVTANTLSRVEITFRDADVAMGDVVKVDYRLKLDNRHLIYQLGQSPVVELVAVRHTDAATGVIRPYTILDSGLKPNQGDVWISNPNTGHISFSENPVGGPKVETPGQLQVEYKVNSGTVVKFVADFPKGVPAPAVEDAPVKNVSAVSGQTSVTLDYPIAKDNAGLFIEPVVKITKAGSTTTLTSGQYQISLDGKTITPNSLSAGDIVNIQYRYERSTHDIYQVAMFDDKVGGKMFNISGIGPVTKDKNTGMRVTWSVTF
ncbi:hypothetical protein C2I27_04020 [Priestia megaterium]|uniref:hypothetical protein n=1 Tax=Priestia megaterium TaxID=1404 RepID=UPI000D51D9D5|nr:hypothetical protein [Priestia megaterium]PVC75062.1 hypothetical protein C2I27_04020 [Priestia megaterium]